MVLIDKQILEQKTMMITCKTIGNKLQTWRQDGEHILICLQHDKSEQWKNQLHWINMLETQF